VIFQAGSSDAGVGLAGKFADAVFTGPATFDEAVAFRAQVRNSAVAHGRPAGHVKIFPGIGIVTGATDAEAEAKFDEIRNLLSIEDALDYLGRFFDHHDFGQYDLDAPFPDLGELGANSFRSVTDRIKADARENGLTLRQVALKSATPAPQFMGNPQTVADQIIHWIDGGAADGFILAFPVAAQGLDDFIQFIIPELERRGRYDRVLHGTTLRDHLGLPFKQSRYAGTPVPQNERRSA
jgi:alkanesulfonate monooxygenase SsuD/methylene tetrahydromethanopterin reductase-like flavin-dependent oxidoreductase (luciferase family)